MSLKLTAFSGKASRGAAVGTRALTTVPGFRNGNRQEVVASTGGASASFRGQRVYRLRCLDCATEYGSNGCDIHLRLCPNCQQGAAGEPLREPAPTFDFPVA